MDDAPQEHASAVSDVLTSPYRGVGITHNDTLAYCSRYNKKKNTIAGCTSQTFVNSRDAAIATDQYRRDHCTAKEAQLARNFSDDGVFLNPDSYYPADIRKIARNVVKKFPAEKDRLEREAEALILIMLPCSPSLLKWKRRRKTLAKKALEKAKKALEKAGVQGEPPSSKRQKIAPATPTCPALLVASPQRTPAPRLQALPQIRSPGGIRLQNQLFATRPRTPQPALAPMSSATPATSDAFPAPAATPSSSCGENENNTTTYSV
jgi:hypothetical protein